MGGIHLSHINSSVPSESSYPEAGIVELPSIMKNISHGSFVCVCVCVSEWMFSWRIWDIGISQIRANLEEIPLSKILSLIFFFFFSINLHPKSSNYSNLIYPVLGTRISLPTGL